MSRLRIVLVIVAGFLIATGTLTALSGDPDSRGTPKPTRPTPTPTRTPLSPIDDTELADAATIAEACALAWATGGPDWVTALEQAGAAPDLLDLARTVPPPPAQTVTLDPAAPSTAVTITRDTAELAVPLLGVEDATITVTRDGEGWECATITIGHPG